MVSFFFNESHFVKFAPPMRLNSCCNSPMGAAIVLALALCVGEAYAFAPAYPRVQALGAFGRPLMGRVSPWLRVEALKEPSFRLRMSSDPAPVCRNSQGMLCLSKYRTCDF